MLPDLLDQVAAPVAAVIADGAYGGRPVYDAVAAVPTRATTSPERLQTYRHPYDRLAVNFVASIYLVAAVVWWSF
jgi:hypothetical protein